MRYSKSNFRLIVWSWGLVLNEHVCVHGTYNWNAVNSYFDSWAGVGIPTEGNSGWDVQGTTESRGLDQQVYHSDEREKCTYTYDLLKCIGDVPI